MTNIQTHVTSLELSQNLKAAGVPQESLFYHIQDEDLCFKRVQSGDEIIVEYEVDQEFGSDYPTPKHVLNNENWSDWRDSEDITICSAYLSSELGEWMKTVDQSYVFQAYIEVTKNTHSRVIYHAEMALTMMTDSDIAGLMLLWLIENGHLDVKTLEV